MPYIKTLLPFTLLLIAFNTMAQNRAIIKGKVIDSATKSPLELATIAVLDMRDTTSSLISYTTSDKKGDFALHNMQADIRVKILITFVSYRPYRKTFTLKKGETFDLGTIRLNPQLLNEVVVMGERPPIVIRKDTIEFNTEAFKTRPNALVEDLLKKLPGIQVDAAGFVLFNGKKVEKILVDGHEFFINDPRIATKNLNADMIDKVQVYDDRDNDPNHLVPDIDVNKIINLKFKKAYKKSIFGKVAAGAGTEDRYTASGLINMFKDTLQVSLLGMANNLNNTGFSFNDLYTLGGVNRGGGSILSRGSFGYAAPSGIQKIISSGVNINTDYGKKLKINLVYFYSRTNNLFNSLTNRQQLTGDTDFTTNSNTSRTSISNSHNLNAEVRIQPNPATQITYAPAFSYTDNQANSNTTGSSFSNFIPQVSQANSIDNNSNNTAQFSQSFTYNYQYKKQGESISISHSLQISPNNGNDFNISDLKSFTTGLTSYDLNRFANSINRNNDFNVGAGFNYPFSKKLAGSIGVTEDYAHNVNNTITYDFDTATGLYDSFLQTLSSNLTRNQYSQSINPGLRYNFKQGYTLSANVNTQVLQVDNQFDRNLPDINQNFVEFLPNINLQLSKFNIGYSKGFTLPNIGDMIPYTVVFSPLYQVTGNPNLKPTTRDNYTFRYGNFKAQSQTSMNFGGSVNVERNTIFRERTLNAVGAETSTPINMDGRYSVFINGSLNKRFKKHNGFTFSEFTNLSVNNSRGFFEINHQDGFQYTYGINLQQQVTLNWKDIIDITQNYTFNTAIVNYTGVNYSSQTNTTHYFDTHFNVFWPKNINIEGTYTYSYNSIVSPGFQKSANLVNLSIAHPLLKHDRGEIKLTCYDIFDQAISSRRTINENIINDTQSQVLRRYFLLTLQFRFNKSLVRSASGVKTTSDDSKEKKGGLIMMPRLGGM
jgi:hypothetical protein